MRAWPFRPKSVTKMTYLTPTAQSDDDRFYYGRSPLPPSAGKYSGAGEFSKLTG